MDEIKLINLVRERKELYDLNHPLYDVRTRRDLAWLQIGEALQQSPRDCREKWKRLRDCYRRAQKLRRLKSEQGAKINKRPKYERILAFLNPHLKDDRDAPSEAAAADYPESSRSDDENSNAEEAPSPAPAAGARPPHRDKLADFFMGLIETVRDLPEDVQIRVKRDVFKVVSDAEELVYKSKTELPLAGHACVKTEK